MNTKSPQDFTSPPWARYKALDASGEWHWFECQPRYNKKLGVWSSKGKSSVAHPEQSVGAKT